MRILGTAALAILAGAGVLYAADENLMVLHTVYEDENNEEILYNPLIGYAPRATSPEAVGNNTLVYIDILWSEIEPQQGVYDFEGVYRDNYVYEYKASGKKAVLRFVCDMPGSETHMDIPQWLYDVTGDGTFYDTSYGKGYSPDYSNETFIEAHEKLLRAMSKEFLNDNFIAYIELGSIGHWGEWHVNTDEGLAPIPTEEVCMRYVAHYVENFPDIRLLMRRPFRGVMEYGLGVYNDMTGEPQSTSEWMGWLSAGGTYEEPAGVHTLYAIQDFYKKAPVGGEFTSRISWDGLLVDNYSRTKDMIEASHMSFIGPKSPHIKSAAEFQKEADELRKSLGYKLGISSAVINYHKLSKRWDFEFQLNNKGIAPIYYDWDCCLYVYDGSGRLSQRITLPVKLSEIMPGGSCIVNTKQQFDILDVSKITVVIEDPATRLPAIRLNNADNIGSGGYEIAVFVQ